MISKPSTAQLIEAVNAELASKVSPELDAGTTRVVLDMAMAVLQGAATRSANELAWMREEEQAVADVAGDWWRSCRRRPVWPRHIGSTRTTGPTACTWPDAMADYERVSEVLSCAAEAVYAEGDPGRIAAVQELFDQRLANENAVIGAFQAVGRTWLSPAPRRARGADSQRPMTAGLPSVQVTVSVRCTMRQPSAVRRSSSS